MTPSEQEMYHLTNRVIQLETDFKSVKSALDSFTLKIDILTKSIAVYLDNQASLGDGMVKIQNSLKALEGRIVKLETKPVEKPKKSWFKF